MKTDKKTEILNQAARTFAQFGYAAASMSTIASAAGVSKAALYHHFATKEEIYAEIVLNVLSKMCHVVDAALQQARDPVTKLRAFMHGHAQFFERQPETITVTHFGFEGLRQMAKREEITQWRDRYERMLRDVLLEGQRADVFGAFDPGTISRMILSTLNDMPRWYNPDGRTSATQFADRYCDVILGGIRQHR